jgi:hypothetical protein
MPTSSDETESLSSSILLIQESKFLEARIALKSVISSPTKSDNAKNEAVKMNTLLDSFDLLTFSTQHIDKGIVVVDDPGQLCTASESLIQSLPLFPQSVAIILSSSAVINAVLNNKQNAFKYASVGLRLNNEAPGLISPTFAEYLESFLKRNEAKLIAVKSSDLSSFLAPPEVEIPSSSLPSRENVIKGEMKKAPASNNTTSEMEAGITSPSKRRKSSVLRKMNSMFEGVKIEISPNETFFEEVDDAS